MRVACYGTQLLRLLLSYAMFVFFKSLFLLSARTKLVVQLHLCFAQWLMWRLHVTSIFSICERWLWVRSMIQTNYSAIGIVTQQMKKCISNFRQIYFFYAGVFQVKCPDLSQCHCSANLLTMFWLRKCNVYLFFLRKISLFYSTESNEEKL